MANIMIVSCNRIRDISCIGCIKCFKAVKERAGEFSRFKDEEINIVAMTTCGNCPGLVMPRLALVKDICNQYQVDFDYIFLGTCIVKATETAKCPIDISELKKKLENKFGKEVIVGTHPW